MVSVVVPVYGVEQYLSQCIESIINQTYRDIEIILVDDGSPDNCDIICDEYAKKDKRIKVFHKKNGGLSDARNFGIARASGEYIGFVDADDWIEPKMYELLVNSAIDNKADIVYCGTYLEYSQRTVIRRPLGKCFTDNVELCKALIKDEIGTPVWNKLYRKHIFTDIIFANGHVYEDTAIMYKLFLKTTILITVSKPLYHYRKERQESITKSYSMANLVDYWLAHKSRYDYFDGDSRFNTDKDLMERLRFFCAVAVARTWRLCFANTRRERKQYTLYLKEMSDFCTQEFPTVGLKEWPLHMRFTIFLSRFNNELVFALLYYMQLGYRYLKKLRFKKLVCFVRSQ